MRSSPSPRSFATSTSTPVTYCTWIRRNWPVSGDLDTASTATAPSGPTASAGRNAHVAIDDHSRVAYVEVLPAEDQHTCTALLQRAVEHFASMGVAVRRVMTDNGPGYVSKRFNRLCHQLEIRHIYTRPYTPRTNGKAERFIRTLKEQWGLRHLLPDLSSTYSSSTALAQPLQSSPSPRRHRHDTADRSALRGEFVNNLPRTHT